MAVPFKVIIIGAGLGGLSCAISCRLKGLEVVVLERAPQIAEVGAGIQIPPNSSKILIRYGLMSKFRECATVVEYNQIRRYRDGRLLLSREHGEKTTKTYGAPWMVLHRQDYHAILLEEAKRLGATITLDACVKKIDMEKAKVTLVDDTELEADVIVGADGLWSLTREAMLGEASPPTETGDLAYRATFTLEQLKSMKSSKIEELCASKIITVWFGPDRHVVFYPLRGGKEFNMVLIRPDDMPAGTRSTQGEISEMRTTFEDWDETLTQIISCISSVLKWKLMHHEELETWTKGHTALLGDACHPTLPYQAQGAAMAVEDGGVLGLLLGLLSQRRHNTAGKPAETTDLVPAVLRLYENLRKKRTTLNVQGALQNRHFYHMRDGPEQEERDRLLSEAGDWKQLSSKYSWLDPKYQMELMGQDSMLLAEDAFESWWKKLSSENGVEPSLDKNVRAPEERLSSAL